MNKNKLRDEFLGMATIQEFGSETPESKSFELFGKKKKDMTVQMPGKVHVEIASSDYLDFFWGSGSYLFSLS